MLAQYLELHYGSPEEAMPHALARAATEFPRRCADLVLEHAANLGIELNKALDIGCAVGRSSFELARACAAAEAREPIAPHHLSPTLGASFGSVASALDGAAPGEPLRETLDRVERWLLRRALETHEHRRTDTARALGLTREGLYKKMKRLNIE